MKNEQLTECPMCEGQLKEQLLLDHPKKGKIPNIPHHICLHCGEVFLSGEAVDLIQAYPRSEKVPA